MSDLKGILKGKYYVVLRKADYWTDFLKSEEECKKHILECVNEYDDDREDYEYRLMTKEDYELYYGDGDDCQYQ